MIYDQFLSARKEGKKLLAILVDPDKSTREQCEVLGKHASDAAVDYFFVGSSILTRDNLSRCVRTLKQNSEIPVVLFPGNTLQLCSEADAILFLSMISGRNAPREWILWLWKESHYQLSLVNYSLLPCRFLSNNLNRLQRRRGFCIRAASGRLTGTR